MPKVTPREKTDIGRLLAQGYSIPEIADKTGRSRSTVWRQVEGIRTGQAQEARVSAQTDADQRTLELFRMLMEARYANRPATAPQTPMPQPPDQAPESQPSERRDRSRLM